MDENRTTPAFGALFALNMLVGTEAGDTYTESEVRTWMEGAGLSNIHRKDTEIGAALMMGGKMTGKDRTISLAGEGRGPADSPFYVFMCDFAVGLFLRFEICPNLIKT